MKSIEILLTVVKITNALAITILAGYLFFNIENLSNLLIQAATNEVVLYLITCVILLTGITKFISLRTDLIES